VSVLWIPVLLLNFSETINTAYPLLGALQQYRPCCAISDATQIFKNFQLYIYPIICNYRLLYNYVIMDL